MAHSPDVVILFEKKRFCFLILKKNQTPRSQKKPKEMDALDIVVIIVGVFVMLCLLWLTIHFLKAVVCHVPIREVTIRSTNQTFQPTEHSTPIPSQDDAEAREAEKGIAIYLLEVHFITMLRTMYFPVLDIHFSSGEGIMSDLFNGRYDFDIHTYRSILPLPQAVLDAYTSILQNPNIPDRDKQAIRVLMTDGQTFHTYWNAAFVLNQSEARGFYVEMEQYMRGML